jgi:hypothetical protein
VLSFLAIASLVPSLTLSAPVSLLRPTTVVAEKSTANHDAVTGTFDPRAFDASELSITLPDGRTLVAHRTHLQRDSTFSTWSGRFDGEHAGTVLLTAYRSVVTGVVTTADATYELKPLSSTGRHKLAPVPAASATNFEPPPPVAPQKSLRALLERAVVGHLPADLAPVTQDLLVLYTPASAARHGSGTLESMIAGGVAAANEAYRNSDVGISLRLLDVRRTATIVESPQGMIATLAALRSSPEARDLRDQLGADIVLLVNESRDWCGYGYIMYSPLDDYSGNAYAAVQSGCIASDMIAHEIGHIQGLMHDRESTPENGALPYGRGYRVCGPNGFRDVMSYACPGASVTRVRQFSNPSKSYRNQPMGVAYEANPLASADAARALNETAAIVAGYRNATSDLPISPGGLTGRSTGRAALLSWQDTSDDETGFAIERRRGKRWHEVARVAAGVVAYTDTTVAARKVYSYRVVAVNAAGRSAASNVVTVHVTVQPSGASAGRLLERGDALPLSRHPSGARTVKR